MAPSSSDNAAGRDVEAESRVDGHGRMTDGCPGGRIAADTDCQGEHAADGCPGGQADAATARQSPRVADEPRTPQRIALVRTSGDAGLGFLLEDFRAAYGAYSRLAGCDLPEFVPVELGTVAGLASRPDMVVSRTRGVEPMGGTALMPDRAAGVDTNGLNADGPCQDTGGAADSVVFACDGAVDAERLDSLAGLLGTGTRLHAIFDLPGLDPTLAGDAARALIDLCERSGALWCGGVAFAGGRPFEALRRSPRMGLLRRPFAESMDMLVGSVRMGCSVRRSQELGGADVSRFDALGLVRATPALPSALWNLTMQALGKVR